MEKNEKSLFDDLISVDEFVPANLTEVDDNQAPDPDEESEEGEEGTKEESGNNPPVEPGTEDGEEVDDRAIALFNFLKEEELVDATEFSGKPSDLVDILDSLPETMFYRAVQVLPQDAQELLNYAFQLGEKADFNALKTFFDKYVDQPVALETDEQAEVYLKNELKNNRLFKTEEKINKYVDDLIEKGELLATAKELDAEKQSSREAARATEVAAVEASRKQAKVEAENFYKTLYDEVQNQPWQDTRKNIVLDNLIPEKVSAVNQLIMKSPKAMIQLADIYSRFNAKSGEFDLTDLALKADTKKVQEKKDAIVKDRASSVLNGITSKGGKTSKGGQSFWTHFEKVEE